LALFVAGFFSRPSLEDFFEQLISPLPFLDPVPILGCTASLLSVEAFPFSFLSDSTEFLPAPLAFPLPRVFAVIQSQHFPFCHRMGLGFLLNSAGFGLFSRHFAAAVAVS